MWTAQYNYGGPDRLDITYKTADMSTCYSNDLSQYFNFYGQWLAPTEDMVKGYKWGWKDLKTVNEKQIRYTHMYNKLMAERWAKHVQEMHDFVQLCPTSMTIVCYCKSGDFCHRQLAHQYLTQLGATYMGERKL